MEETKKLTYKKGESVVCIINSRANLTIGKEYTIIDVYGNSSTDIQEVWTQYQNECTLVINNDNGDQQWYDHMRFVPKSEFRSHKINEILK